MNARSGVLVVGLAVAVFATGGCRAVFLSGMQDVTVNGPPGSLVIVDGTHGSPGVYSLARNRDHVISTDWGWKTTVEHRFATGPFIVLFLLVSGPFEFIDFANGTAYRLEPVHVNIPPKPADKL